MYVGLLGIINSLGWCSLHVICLVVVLIRPCHHSPRSKSGDILEIAIFKSIKKKVFHVSTNNNDNRKFKIKEK